jgi:hypothetical protein
MPAQSGETVPCGLHPDIEQLSQFAQTQDFLKLDRSTGVLVALRVEPEVYAKFFGSTEDRARNAGEAGGCCEAHSLLPGLEDGLKSADRHVRHHSVVVFPDGGARRGT